MPKGIYNRTNKIDSTKLLIAFERKDIEWCDKYHKYIQEKYISGELKKKSGKININKIVRNHFSSYLKSFKSTLSPKELIEIESKVLWKRFKIAKK